MTATIQTEHPESHFDLTDALKLGAILLAGIVVVITLQTVKIGELPAITSIAGIIPTGSQAVFHVLLWLVEFALYFAIAWHISQRNTLVGVGGIAVGLIVRLLVSLLLVLVLNIRFGEPIGATFSAVHGTLWPLRLIGIIMVAGIFALPCRNMIACGFGTAAKDTEANHPRAKSFSFNTAHHESTTASLKRKPMSGGQASRLVPPDNFTPLPPKDGVSGLVSVPAEVICASIPEAAEILTNGVPVRIRLSYIVPQLRRPTVWLTWEQIFLHGLEDPNRHHGGPNREDKNFQGHWIVIPPKYYVSQVPQEFFQKDTVVAPTWMRRSAVAQEAQFDTVAQ